MLLKWISQSNPESWIAFQMFMATKYLPFFFFHCPKKSPAIAHEFRCFRTSWVNVKETICSCWGVVSLLGMAKGGWPVGTPFTVAAILDHYNYFGISV